MTINNTSLHATDNDDLDAKTAAEDTAYLETYRPQALTASQWDEVGDDIRRLVLLADHHNLTDARLTLGAVCRFLAWTATHLGSLDVDVVLTDAQVDVWIAQLRRSKASAGAVSNLRGRLRRLLRVIAGEPARTKREPRRQGPQPYDRTELARLAEQAATSPDLTVALALTLMDGVVLPKARTAHHIDPAHVGRRLAELGVDARLALNVQVAAVLDDASWGLARRAANDCGITLTTDRRRATWLIHELTQPVPLAVTASRLGLSRADLDRAVTRLPGVTDDLTRELLRG